jgi:hypothetical protein
MLSGDVARSMDHWIASHMQGPSAGRLLLPPHELTALEPPDAMGELVRALAQRSSDVQHAARMLLQLGLEMAAGAQQERCLVATGALLHWSS